MALEDEVAYLHEHNGTINESALAAAMGDIRPSTVMRRLRPDPAKLDRPYVPRPELLDGIVAFGRARDWALAMGAILRAKEHSEEDLRRLIQPRRSIPQRGIRRKSLH